MSERERERGSERERGGGVRGEVLDPELHNKPEQERECVCMYEREP